MHDKIHAAKIYITPLDDQGSPLPQADRIDLTDFVKSITTVWDQVTEAIQPIVNTFQTLTLEMAWSSRELINLLSGFTTWSDWDYAVDKMGIARSDIRKIENGYVYLYNWRKIPLTPQM